MMDRRGTDPSSAAGHQDAFLGVSVVGVTVGDATTRTNVRPRHRQHLRLRQTPLVAGPLDPQGTGLDTATKMDERGRDQHAGKCQEHRDEVFPVLAPKRPFQVCRAVSETTQKNTKRI